MGSTERKGHLPASLEIQLSTVYGKNNKILRTVLPRVQQQKNGVDCGIFAIANLVEFCFNGFKGECDIDFDTVYMRKHQLECIQRGIFTKFPKNKINRNAKKKKSPLSFDIFIDCEADAGLSVDP